MKKQISLISIVLLLLLLFGCESSSSPVLISDNNAIEISEETHEGIEKDKFMTDPVPEGKPDPIEPEKIEINQANMLTAKLSITCKTILDNIENLDPEKIELLPIEGVIYKEEEVEFYAGESVFDILLRETKQRKLHMEFVNTPIYNSAYIEGINNLYEFDCGELSGWMYKVNNWFPNYGCSRYKVQDGDLIEWIYTCDLGKDIGAGYIGGDGDE